MSKPAPNWDDLRPRILTGGALIAVGVLVIWLGGSVFAVTAALVTGIMVWELSIMIAKDQAARAMQLGVLAAACLLLARQLPGISWPLLIVPAAAGAYLLRRHMAVFAAYALGITVAGFGLALFRDSYGVVWIFWLVAVVAVTDIAGYFGGRMIGGKKFWPAISPKKTWSGVICGWLGAAVVGLIFLMLTEAGRDLIWISMVLSFASQLGDVAESAIKRRMGVKDSSNLLPGHGGLLDRFDALLGAALFMLLVALVVDVPELRF